MENSKYFLLHISLFIVFLSLPLSFSTHHHRCPAHCVCTCPASPDQPNLVPPPNIYPPSQENNQNSPPPTTSSSVPPTSGSNPPLQSALPPQMETAPPPTSSSTSPPTSIGATPPFVGSIPPIAGSIPPPTSIGATPPSAGSVPPIAGSIPPPTSIGATPPSAGSVPPIAGSIPPPTSIGTPTPSTGSVPPIAGSIPPPTSVGATPPLSGIVPPIAGSIPPPTSIGTTPPLTGGIPPIAGSTPPPNLVNSPSPPTGTAPPTSGSVPPPIQPSTSPPPTEIASPPISGNALPPTQASTSPPSTGSAPPTQPTTSPPPTESATSPPAGITAPPSTFPPSQGNQQNSPPGQDNDIYGCFQGSFSKVFAFGDSFTDTGNSRFLGGFKPFIGGSMSHSPYGSTTPLPGQRLSNGRLVIDYLCDALGIPPLPAYKQNSANFSCGANFAISGATSLSNDFFTNHKISHTLMWKGVPESFQTQIDWFHKFLSSVDCKGKSEDECRAEMGNTLFWIGELGANDYARIFGSPIQVRWLTQMSVTHVCKILQTMMAMGAKYFVVQGLPPAGCCPIDLALRPKEGRDNLGCSSIANTMISAHNDLLQMRLDELRQLHPDCQIIYADTWNAYKTILANPEQFQFEEPFKACCGAGGGPFNFDLHSLCGATGTSICKNPENYINWDGIHLTEAMNKQIANLFFKGGFCKPSIDEMIKAKKLMAGH